jgi:hypothetical protein
VVDGRRRGRKVGKGVHLGIEREGDIVAQQLPVVLIERVPNGVYRAGEACVETRENVAICERRSQRWDPRKPAPPVMGNRFRATRPRSTATRSPIAP